MSRKGGSSDSSNGFSSQSVARLLLILILVSIIGISLVVPGIELIIEAGGIFLLLFIIYLLWDLTRSVTELNKRLKNVEEKLDRSE